MVDWENKNDRKEETARSFPVSEKERPALSTEFYEKLLGFRNCESPEHCTNCGRCEY